MSAAPPGTRGGGRSIPADAEILFLPDFFLGDHVARTTGRHLDLWMGECHVHVATSTRARSSRRSSRHSEATLLIHPECGCTSTALYLLGRGELPRERTRVLSTGSMVDAARELGEGTALVANRDGHPPPAAAANPRAASRP